MNAILRSAALAAALAVGLAVPSVARAETKMTGVLTRLELAEDGKTAVATLKDAQTAALVPITVVDDVTLQKFQRSVISIGDEIKAKYDRKGKKSVATSFKRAAGCS